jgi:hypothetical protein
METNEKTIRMPKELADKWLAALRGGEYKQGRYALRCRDGYCCLGVLEMAIDGSVETDGKTSRILPSIEWLHMHGIRFVIGTSREARGAPFLPSLNCTASVANDDGGYDFLQIADAIEAALEYMP